MFPARITRPARDMLRGTPAAHHAGPKLEERIMMEFQVGDKAVYPSQGVAEVVGIDRKEIMGKIMHFYVLRILDSDRRISVPAEKADQVGLREVVAEDQIREVFNILKEKEIHIDKQTWNRRYRGFMEKIKT